MGLMQMIASTARHTAYQHGVAFDLSRMISEPSFNAKLGAAHLGILLGEYKGAYLLTFAAYNAGGGRVKQWIDAYGDPRKPGVDPVDWVERIPITETRNYVQRVMENFVVYRSKFGDTDTRAPQVELARAGDGL
jgi:soluble lytic murein transglycosylase